MTRALERLKVLLEGRSCFQPDTRQIAGDESERGLRDAAVPRPDEAGLKDAPPEQAAEPDSGQGGPVSIVHVSGPERPASVVSVITQPAEFEALLPELLAAPCIGLDTETTGLDPRTDRLRLVQLAIPGRTILADCFQWDPCALAPVITNARRLTGHNLKFDLAFLAAAGLEIPNGDRLFDTMLAAQLLGAGTENGRLDRCGLRAVTSRVLGTRLDKGQQTSDWSGSLTEEQLAYAAGDAAILLPLAARLDSDLTAAGLRDVARLEMRTLPAIVWLEQTGAPFAAERWAGLSDLAVAEQIRLEHALAQAAGAVDQLGTSTINWRSPAQLLRILQARGHRIDSTDEATLRALADRDPLANLLLAYREANRRASAYGIEFLKHLHPITGRIHADFLQIGAASGRMACTRPNLQNIPRDLAYRACFRPVEGRVLIKADYSQIELRIAAQISDDAAMRQAFQHREDLHIRTAATVLGIDPAAVDKSARQLAKALNFGLIYGMGADRLREYAATSYGVSLTEAEARRFRTRFFAAYPGLRRWHQCQLTGPVTTRTLLGRHRLEVIRFTEKLNTPVQGSAADGLKAALARLWETRAQVPSAAPVLTVHDEVVIECDADQAGSVATWLTEQMTAGMATFAREIPVEVEVRVADDWSGQRNR